MSGKNLLLCIAALISGIFIGNLSFIPIWFSVFPVVLSVGLFIFSFLSARRNPFSSSPNFNLLTALLVFCGVGVFTSSVYRPATVDFEAGKYAFSGEVVEYTPTGNGDKLLLSLFSMARIGDGGSAENIDVANVSLLLTVKNGPQIDYGDRITCVADLVPVEAPANYLNQDYTAFLKSKRIFLTGFAEAGKCNIASPSRSSLGVWFKHLRYNLEIGIEKTPLSVAAKDFLISFLLGDKSYIKSQDRITFTDAGVAHIFAVSGFHVSMVGVFILALLSVFFHGKAGRWKFLLCLPLVWFYILLVGASPSTCRAGLMLSIAMIALFMQRKSDALRSLGWAVLIILSFYPGSLFDIGFQLSVICVGSILLIAQPLNFMRHREHPRLYKLVSVVLVSLTATFSVWLVCGFYFHKFSLMFLPLNLLAVPLLPAYIVLSLVYIVLFELGIDVAFFRLLIDNGYELFQRGAAFLTSHSYSFENFHPGAITVWLWLVAVAVWGTAFKLREDKRGRSYAGRLFWAASVLFFSSVVSLPLLVSRNLPSGLIIQKNNLEATVMCYSQGREQVVTLPPVASAETVLNGKRIVSLNSPVLSDSTLSRLPFADIILICGDCTELPDFLDKRKDGCLVVTHPTLHWRHERSILADAEKTGVAVHSIRYSGPLHIFD